MAHVLNKISDFFLHTVCFLQSSSREATIRRHRNTRKEWHANFDSEWPTISIPYRVTVGNTDQVTSEQFREDFTMASSHIRRYTTSSQEAIQTDAETLCPAIVLEVLDAIGKLWHHIPYVITGTAAEMFYGRDCLAYSVTMLCPESARLTFQGWVAASGIQRVEGRREQYRVPVQSGRYHLIRVHFLSEGFEELEYVQHGQHQTRIITLPCMADEIAKAYIGDLVQQQGRNQAFFAAQVFWVLQRSETIRCSRQRVTSARVPHMLSDAFYVPFTATYPDAKATLDTIGRL